MDKPLNRINLSIVVPLLDEEESLPELVSWIDKVCSKESYLYELILVDDGSTDNSWKVITELMSDYESLRGVRFNRNYGKSAALDVGFRYAQGDVVITMDADLQDSPDEIPALYQMIISDGYDMVSGWKKKRYDPISKTIPSKFFNYVTSKISGIRLHDFNCGLKAYRHNVIKSLTLYGEMHRYIPVIVKNQGFKKIGEKVVEHRARKYGSTKFGLERFIFGFLDLLSVTFVTKFRKRPMHLFGSLGTLSFISGTAITIYLIWRKLYHLYNHLPARDIVDQPLFFLALVAVVAGIQLFLAGFLAEMITQTDARKSDYNISESLRIAPSSQSKN
ncbi:MAG: glycosyltransferase family 2 protein [Cyclobacteriaceae bacterium]|nr:glycosyltransferase family 2 protein [Cyclobacteriaceae bacterium]MCH8516725.1 glycosyltransferase family 2 protein [Cyclobacteriaceae bacterium]